MYELGVTYDDVQYFLNWGPNVGSSSRDMLLSVLSMDMQLSGYASPIWKNALHWIRRNPLGDNSAAARTLGQTSVTPTLVRETPTTASTDLYWPNLWSLSDWCPRI